MKFKHIFWKVAERILSNNNFRAIFYRQFPHTQSPSSNNELKHSALSDPSVIYRELHNLKSDSMGTPIFITARFRSGSTLLWNIFRQIDGLHSYYEPLNERMWFDKTKREGHIDKSHLGVKDYWCEYDHLVDIAQFFSKGWTNKRLLMDQTSFDSDLSSYISSLINQSPDRPVLQFNRVDFRLQWLKANFSNAKIIHLYRHPRDQWISVSKYSSPINLELSGHDFTSYNLFYTIEWARNLTPTFPFLDPLLCKHPYYYHYLLWRLSYIYGQTFSDISISFEDLVTDTKNTLSSIFNCIGVTNVDEDLLKDFIVEQKLGKWATYADDAWYKGIEIECEDLLEKYFS